MTESRPYLSHFKDRHGKTRWRFRRASKTISLLGQPGEPEFERAYQDALDGRKQTKAKVTKHPNAALPGTLGAAWIRVQKSAEWKAYDQATVDKNTYLAEMFLESQVVEHDPYLWKNVPVRDLRRRHLKEIISKYSATPHKAKHLLTTIRKMIYVALDEEWIDVDPSYKLKWRPEYVGWKAWTTEAMQKYEAKWKVGSTPRLVYAIALWLGNRRADVATLRWDQQTARSVSFNGEARIVDGFNIRQGKTGKDLFVPITPMLSEILQATERKGETVLVTAYGQPFSPKSLTGRMADWTKSAGLEPGFTLHGLRKTLGKMLAEGGASTRQIMETLGHDDIEHAELYSREAEQARLATDGMDRVMGLLKR